MEEPCFLLACQRNVTASSVQGQTGECSLQLSITPGAGRDTHRELSVFSFIYLFLFSPFYVSSISRSLPYFVAFPASPSFVTFLSYRTCQHLPSARRFYTNTWIFSNNFSSSSFSLLYAVCINIQPNPERGRDSACTSITHMQPPDHPHSSCHTHTQLNRLAPTCSNLQTLTQLILIIHYSILEYISLQDYNTGVRIFYLI